jgi:hypothetical protein
LLASSQALIKRLELDGAESDIADLEALIKDADDDNKDVASFKSKIRGGGNKEEPTSEADWIKLRDSTATFDKLVSDFPGVVREAQRHSTKSAQVGALQPTIQKAIDEWPGKSVDDRLKKAGRDGDLEWISERIDRLRAPPPPSASDLQRQAEQAEWNAFLADVKAGWDAFVASSFSPAKRGVDIKSSLKTTYVQAEMSRRASVTIDGKKYTKSDSRTAGVSLKRAYPEPSGGYPANLNGDLIASYIYHL